MFSNYRSVPWLIRSHGVTVLPSVAAILTLRSLPSGDPGRKPFAGFGDPYFSEDQARRARARARTATGAPTDSWRLEVRNVVKSPSDGVAGGGLSRLPRLPDTADEIRGIADAMKADMADVFLGERANVQTVKSLDLSRYRVLAFATHGLVPGDVDGLTQPALALSAPEVARIEGDGLPTMEDILGLKLNADWVVLSACNTANGNGAGAEAISGLGRAFFYAGARAVLVTSWPVETTSARALTTTLFKRLSDRPGLSRASALQQTLNALIDEGIFADPHTRQAVFSYAHPIFWAPFALVGDGG